MKPQFTLVALSLSFGLIAGYSLHEIQNSSHSPAIQTSPTPAKQEYIETAFSPDQGATDLVVKTIRSAHKSVRVASYSFTSEEIANALIAEHKEGTDVQVVTDSSNRKGRGSKVAVLRKNGVPIRLNDQFAIMHNKFIIIDGNTVELGSFNYTSSAEHRNAENVLVLHNNTEIAKRYNQQWDALWAGAKLK